RLPNSARMPIFEYIAKNVGIRRARGEYVLITNPDIVFTQELIRYFAARGLRGDAFYRVDRYDVNRSVPLALPVERQLRFCAQHAVLVRRTDSDTPAKRLPRARRYLAANLPRLKPRNVVRGVIRRGKVLVGLAEP